MKASKENAREAKIHVVQLRSTLTAVEMTPSARQTVNDRLEFLDEFLGAAKRKLPTEDAYQTDSRRARKKPSNKSEAPKRIKATKRTRKPNAASGSHRLK